MTRTSASPRRVRWRVSPRLGELQKLFADYQNGIANLGEYQVPIADMPPQLRAQLDAYNAELFKNIQNEFTLTGFDLEQSAAIA